MQPLSPADQASLEEHLRQAARILKQHTEPEKLEDFESLEIELREQLLNQVNPTIAEVFLTPSQFQKPVEVPEWCAASSEL